VEKTTLFSWRRVEWERVSRVLAFSFILLGLARFPFLWWYPFPYAPNARDFLFFGGASWGAAAFVLIVAAALSQRLVRSNWDACVAGAASLLLVVAAVNFVRHQNETIRFFFLSAAWVSIPWAVYLHRRAFSGLVGPCFLLLWSLNLCYAVPRLFSGAAMIGLPANWNWHGSLVVATTPFAVYYSLLFLRRIGAGGWRAWCAVSPFLAVMAVVLYRCQSRGANLGLAVAAALCAFAYGVSSSEPRTRRLTSRIAAASLLATLLGVVAIVFFRGEKVAEAINEDVRVPLWEGAAAMALAHPVVGVGQPEYESSYAAYVPLSRFLRSKYYTPRSDHPHNHFLYLAGAFGFAGLFAIVLLSLAPLVVCATRFRSLGTISKLCFFAYTALLTHSMFDVVASRWPTDMVFLLAQGVLLGDAVALLASRSSNGVAAGVRGRVPRWVAPLELTALALSFACVVGVVLVDLKSSRLRWIGKTLYDAGEVPAAFHAYGESIAVSPDPTAAYDAGIFSLLYFQDPYLGLKYFSILEKLPDRILSHANSHMADCMLRLGRRRDALHYLGEEVVAQPTSLVALRNQLALERALGLDVAAERTAERLIAILKFKGMTLKDLGRVLRNPDLDGHFNKLNTRERRN